MIVYIGRAAAIAATYAAIQFSSPLVSMASTETPNLDANGRLVSCAPTTNCVSSVFSEPPNRYVSPFKSSKDRDVAFQRAVRDLGGDGNRFSGTVAEILPKYYYIHILAPGKAGIDDLEMVYAEGNVVNVRCEARVTLPVPPFCVKKNCINGNMDQRLRVEELGRFLGLPPSDQQQMQTAKWTPIFFNSDRVPGFDDDDDT